MNPAGLHDLFAAAAAPVVAAGLAAARLFGLLSILPIFTRLGLTGLVRGGVALALGLVMWPALLPQVDQLNLAAGAITLLLVKEAAIGLLVGLVFSLPFWVLESAGEIIDQQRGSTSAIIPDPSQTAESGITATLLVLSGTVVFLGMGGMNWIIEAVIDSYRVWPATAGLPTFTPQAGVALLGMLDRLLAGGLLYASPLLIAMLLAELSLALLNRFAPQINVFDLAMAVKGIVYGLGMPVYVAVLLGTFRDIFAPLAWIGRELRLFAG